MKSISDSLLIIIVILTTWQCTPSEVTGSNKIAPNPNILLILTDDMGFGDVSSSGNLIISTPNLDKLAEKSVRFNYFYVSPVCAPTRASLLTGRYHQRTGVRSVTNGYETMDPEESTMAEILKLQGYRTALFGKWHLGEYYPSVPNAQGFDEYLGFRTGHTNNYFNPVLEHNGKYIQNQGYITDILTDKAMSFMLEKSPDPFFCYLAYNAPHTPLQIDSSWINYHLENGLDERTARIYGMIENIDQNVGRILDTLVFKGLLQNTMVIFMSDNGPINGWQVPQEEMRYNAGLRDQKYTVYEGGIRTQCYWLWNDHWKPTETDQIAAHIDVLPTIMGVLGVDLPSTLNIDGISLMPILENESAVLPERIFFEKFALQTLGEPASFPGGMARKGPWKMVNGKDLYNVLEDRGEQVDLSQKYPDILSELNAAYDNWYSDIADDRGLKSIEITLGHAGENPVYLQPHHGKAYGNVEFWGNRGLVGERTGTHPSGVDGDWTGSWQTTGDAIEWNVRFVEAGTYAFKLLARDHQPRKKIKLEFSLNGNIWEQSIPANSLTSEWKELELNTSPVTTGPYMLKISLTEDITSKFEIRAMVVEKLPL